MKIHITSDWHTEYNGIKKFKNYVIPNDTDFVVYAGDMGNYKEIIPLMIDKKYIGPIIFVTGNHEYYDSEIEFVDNYLENQATEHGLTFLQNSSCTIYSDDVADVFGCTLWSDFEISGNKHESMNNSKFLMNDYKFIRKNGRILTPHDTLEIHQKSLKKLEKFLISSKKSKNKKTIVVTHHCPSPSSIAEQFKNSPVNGAFTSDLRHLMIKYEPDLWIHGHSHFSFDYYEGKTRVICNPHGYGNENSKFNESLVVEI